MVLSKKCVNCGSLLDDDAKFCPECGAKQPESLRKCANCGSELPAGAKFCLNCGAAVDSTVSSQGAQCSPTSQSEFEVEELDENTLLFNILGIPFKMKFVKGGMLDNVELSDFYIGETVVTQALWQTVMGKNPSKDISNLNYPVTNLEENDVTIFLNRLEKITGAVFAAPTFSQFCYAVQKGNDGGILQHLKMTWRDNALHEVCGLIPNTIGLYDLCDWPQMVSDSSVFAREHYYRFNPSYKDGPYYVSKNLDGIVTFCLKKPTAYEDWMMDILYDESYFDILKNKNTATIRLVLNIPVSPEMYKNKRELETNSWKVDKQVRQDNEKYIISWLGKYNTAPAEYKIRMMFDGNAYMDVNGDVRIVDKTIDCIPVRFGRISGSFSCEGCKSLESISDILRVEGSFCCKGCTSLETLEALPRFVGGDFDCSGCPHLEELCGLETVGGNLNIIGTDLDEDDIDAKVKGDVITD